MALNFEDFGMGEVSEPSRTKESIHTPRIISLEPTVDLDEGLVKERHLSSNDLKQTVVEPRIQAVHSYKTDPVKMDMSKYSYSETDQYCNASNSPVWLVRATGIRNVIKPSGIPGIAGKNKELLIIHREFKFDSTADINATLNAMTDYCKSICGTVHPEAEHYIRSLKNSASRTGFDRNIIRIEINIDITNIGVVPIYIESEDLLITSSHRALHPNDPNSEYTKNILKTCNRANVTSTSIYIVDNTNTIGNRFIFNGGVVQEIIPIQDKSQHDGVYVTRTKSDGKGIDSILDVKHYDFSEVEGKMIFDKVEAAMTGGNPKVISEKEKAEAQHAAKIAARELEELQNRYTRAELERKEAEEHSKKIQAGYDQELIERNNKFKLELAERDARMKRLEDELKAREIERKEKSMERADRYERDSYHRKNSSEMMKVMAPAAAAVITWLVATRMKA